MESNHVGIIRGRSIPLFSLLLHAMDLNGFGAECEACEASFFAKVVLLFKIGDGFGKIISWERLELTEEIRQEFTSRTMTKKLNEILDFGNILIHIIEVSDVQLANVGFHAGFKNIGVGEYNAC